MILTLIRQIFGLNLGKIKFISGQNGEDAIIDHLLRHRLNINIEGGGFYVDVGCNNPILYSNTFQLYLAGWSGICIDGNDNLVRKFKKTRPKDQVVQALVSDEEREVNYYIGKGNAALSTIEEDFKEKSDFDRFHDPKKVKTITLTSILDSISPSLPRIDLLTIDTEGHDLNVLKSLDFNKYQPKLIVAEFPLDLETTDHEIIRYLKIKNYKLVAYATGSGYFIQNTRNK